MITRQKRLLFSLPASHRQQSSRREGKRWQGAIRGQNVPRSAPWQPFLEQRGGQKPTAGMWRGWGWQEGGWDQPGSACGSAANGGTRRHAGRGGSRVRGARPANKGSLLFLSPAAPRCCLPALDCSCVFSASAVYWVTPLRTHAQRASHPLRPSPCHQHREPLRGPGSTVVALSRAGRAPEPALLWGWGHWEPPPTSQASSSRISGQGGVWACRSGRSCPRFDRTSFGGVNVSRRRPV